MKKLTLFLLLFVSVTVINAQSPLNLGIKAGYNSSKISVDAAQFNEGSVNNYLAGAFARLNLGKIYIQPEAYFNSRGGILDEVIDGNPIDTKNAFDLKTIDVPVLLGVKVYEKGSLNLRANVGPVLSFITDKEIEGSGFDVNDLKDNFFGWQYGIGADLLFLSLDVRMESSSSDIYSGSALDGTKSKVFIVSLGIKLL